jgi:Ribbon-Helix-Helix transcriptional regulator family
VSRTLQEHEKKHQMLAINVVGAVHFAHDVTADLARRTISSIKDHGVLRASPAVREALADRMR